MWCRQQLVPRAGDRELTAGAGRGWSECSQPGWAAEGLLAPVQAGPSSPAACGAQPRAPGAFVRGLALGEGSGAGAEVGGEHLPPPAQRPRAAEWTCVGPPQPPPVWFEFLEQWRVTECSSLPPLPSPPLLAGGPGPRRRRCYWCSSGSSRACCPGPRPAKLQPLLESQAQRQRAWPVRAASDSHDPVPWGLPQRPAPPPTSHLHTPPPTPGSRGGSLMPPPRPICSERPASALPSLGPSSVPAPSFLVAALGL